MKIFSGFLPLIYLLLALAVLTYFQRVRKDRSRQLLNHTLITMICMLGFGYISMRIVQISAHWTGFSKTMIVSAGVSGSLVGLATGVFNGRRLLAKDQKEHKPSSPTAMKNPLSTTPPVPLSDL